VAAIRSAVASVAGATGAGFVGISAETAVTAIESFMVELGTLAAELAAESGELVEATEAAVRLAGSTVRGSVAVSVSGSRGSARAVRASRLARAVWRLRAGRSVNTVRS